MLMIMIVLVLVLVLVLGMMMLVVFRMLVLVDFAGHFLLIICIWFDVSADTTWLQQRVVPLEVFASPFVAAMRNRSTDHNLE